MAESCVEIRHAILAKFHKPFFSNCSCKGFETVLLKPLPVFPCLGASHKCCNCPWLKRGGPASAVSLFCQREVLQACFKCLVAFSWTPELPLGIVFFNAWNLLSCGGSCLAEAGFPREGVSGHKPVPRGLFPFVAFSVPEAFKKKRRPFPIDCGFQPQAVSSSSLVPSRGGFRPEAYHPAAVSYPKRWALSSSHTFLPTRSPHSAQQPGFYPGGIPCCDTLQQACTTSWLPHAAQCAASRCSVVANFFVGTCAKMS